MSSSELSSGEGTTAARREAAQGRNGAALRAATRSRAAEGQPAASMCALLRRGRSSAKQQRVLLRVPAAQGPLMRPLVARHAVGHNKKDPIAPLGDVDRAYLSHTAPVRVGNVPAPWLFVLVSLAMPPRFVPLPQRAASELDGAHIARLGRPRVPSSNAVGFAAEGCLAPFVGPCSRATTFSHLTFARSRRHHVREGRCHRW